MAHFYGDLQGNRGHATRCGTKNSGMVAHIRGWNIGVQVYVTMNEYGEDEVKIFVTSGSNGGKPSVPIGRFTRKWLDDQLK